MSKRTLFATACVACLLTSGLANAAPYSGFYVFGDSLSDRGNLAETGILQTLAGQPIANYPDPPSNHDSFTNGPVAVSLLANSFGLFADPSLWVTGFQDINNLFGGPAYIPGGNYAVAGATAQFQAVGGPGGINLPQQIGAYLFASGNLADPNALYTLLIGGNDIRNAALQSTGVAAVTAGVQSELAAAAALIGAGARNLLVINVPNVGVIPEFQQDNPTKAADATNLTVAYNSQLGAGLDGLATPPGTTITQFDLFAFNTEINANLGSLGFTNNTTGCYTATPLFAATSPECGPNAANINQFVYWDAIHPTGRLQALWAQGAADALAGDPEPTAVPEPITLTLLATGLAALATTRRLRKRA